MDMKPRRFITIHIVWHPRKAGKENAKRIREEVERFNGKSGADVVDAVTDWAVADKVARELSAMPGIDHFGMQEVSVQYLGDQRVYRDGLTRDEWVVRREAQKRGEGPSLHLVE